MRFVSSFSGNDANDGLTAGTAWETLGFAWANTPSDDTLFISNAASFPNTVGSTGPTNPFGVRPYNEVGGASYTTINPQELASGGTPRIAALIELGNTSFQAGPTSFMDVIFNDGAVTGISSTEIAAGSASTFVGCEFNNFRGAIVEPAPGSGVELYNGYVHDNNGIINQASGVNYWYDSYISLSWQNASADTIGIRLDGNKFQNTIFVIEESVVSNGFYYGLFDSFQPETLRGNTIINKPRRTFSYVGQPSVFYGNNIADNIIYGFDGAASEAFLGGTFVTLRVKGSNSFYNSTVGAIYYSQPSRLDISDLDVIKNIDPFIDIVNNDFRLINAEVAGNKSIIKPIHIGLVRGAVQENPGGGGTTNNIFILND